MRAGLNKILAAVSRSFYLTIRILPPFLREPIGLAYLLARTSDTIADSAAAPASTRLEVLRQMGNAVAGQAAMPDLTPFIAGVCDPAERELLKHAGELLELLDGSDPSDRDDINEVIQEILRGQELDILRFAENHGQVRFLANEKELEDYTYSVAGCVGVFWTRICSRHLREYAREVDSETLLKWGEAFGKGLQLVNILRDAPADLANGRCYLPLNAFAEISSEGLQKDPSSARPVYDCWLAKAHEWLEEGLRYTAAIRPWRLRLACFLPWALGVRTLRLLELSRSFETSHRVKVPRKEVRCLLFWGLLASTGNFALHTIAAKVKKP